METKRPLTLLLVFFACYLILSLSCVSAYSVGEITGSGKAQFIIEPVLKIVDDLKPINCESSGYLTLRAYIENVPEFSITGSEASVYDVSTDSYYNVTSSLSCPNADLISNQEFTCRINVKELLSKITTCPLERVNSKFYLTLEIAYGDRKAKVADEKTLTLTEAGAEPGLEIDFYVSQPPYTVPKINCRTGSEIDVPVVMHHAETLFGAIAWSSSVDGVSAGATACERILSREDEGRNDIYLCTLVVPNTLFGTCEDGTDVLVGIGARTSDYNMSGSFPTTLVAQDLDLSLRLSGIEKLECQIIDEEGTCIPTEPQQNVTATITGNVPERLKVFEARYRLGDDNTTLTSCRKITAEKYECAAFITIDRVPMPAQKTDRTNSTRDLTLFFDVKYLNYYQSISAKTRVEMEGRMLSELLNTLELLEKSKGILADIGNISKWQNRAYIFIDALSNCCLLPRMLEQLTFGTLKESITLFGETFLWGSAKGLFSKAFNLLVGNGPALVGCIAEEAMKDIDKEIKNLQDFESGQITAQLEIPSFSKLMLENYPKCRAENFWNQVIGSSNKWRLLCGILLIIIAVVTGGGAITICEAMKGSGITDILDALNKLLALLSVLLLFKTYELSMTNLALSRERINLQLAATNILTGYTQALQSTMETLVVGLSVNSVLQNLTSPSYDTIKLIFTSDRAGVLGNGDDMCSGDEITIDYDFEKLNQTSDFRSQLSIANSHQKTLRFEGLKGTYGPYKTDMLLGTDPAADPSEPYTFTLYYADKRIDYVLNYVNHPCAAP